MGNPTVHYFSLDIEGAEFAVLKTIPWNKVDIRVLTVETHLAGKVFPGTRTDIIEYMNSVGYRMIDMGIKAVKDDVFVRNDIEVINSIKEDEDLEVKRNKINIEL